MGNSLTVREVQNREEWNALVLSLPNHDLRQGYEWGEARASQGWTPRRIAVFEGEVCIAAVAVLVKRIPLVGRSILYAPGGPLLGDSVNDSGLEWLMTGLRQVATETNAIFLRVSPNKSDEDLRMRNVLVARGFQNLAEDWTTWNTPRITMISKVAESVEFLYQKLRKRFRDYISSAPKRRVSVRKAESVKEARDFRDALALVGRGKHVPVRGKSYFERLWEEYVTTGQGVLLLAEHDGNVVGGLIGAKLGNRAHMLYVMVRERRRAPKLQQGPLLYWEFVHWAKLQGCSEIDWGGVGTNFPPRKEDPGLGVYHFKLGFNSSLQYRTGYYDWVFAQTQYNGFRFLERKVAATAWTFRAKLNGRLSEIEEMIRRVRRKTRQLQLSVNHRGIKSTLFWASFGFLRLNRFIVLSRILSGKAIQWVRRDGLSFEMWDVKTMRAWREKQRGLPLECFQDEIDQVETCAVALVKGEMAGLIWVYSPDDISRLFVLQEDEVELNNGYVLPRYRGRGLFRDLLAFSCRWLQERDYKTAYAMVHSTNETSLQAFRYTGFRELDRVRHFLLFRPKVCTESRLPDRFPVQVSRKI